MFDAEWEAVLESAERTKDLTGSELLAHWRHIAFQELREPGTYFRVLATAAQVQATRQPPPGSLSGGEVRARIAARLVGAGSNQAVPGSHEHR